MLKYHHSCKDGEGFIYSDLSPGAKRMWIEGILGFTNWSLEDPHQASEDRANLVNFRTFVPLSPLQFSYIFLCRNAQPLHQVRIKHTFHSQWSFYTISIYLQL